MQRSLPVRLLRQRRVELGDELLLVFPGEGAAEKPFEAGVAQLRPRLVLAPGDDREEQRAKERVEDATQHLKVGDAVEAKFVGMDRKGRSLQLSIRAKDEDELQSTLEEYQSATGGTTKLGALLKEQLNR